MWFEQMLIPIPIPTMSTGAVSISRNIGIGIGSWCEEARKPHLHSIHTFITIESSVCRNMHILQQCANFLLHHVIVEDLVNF